MFMRKKYEYGEWVQTNTERFGFIEEKLGSHYKIRFGNNETALFSLQNLKTAPTNRTREDIHIMQSLAVNTKDKHWFYELAQQLIEKKDYISFQ